MRFDVVTLFPELFAPHLSLGVTRRAFADDGLQVVLWPLRDFGVGPHQRIDDRPYGGGPGMVLMAEPLQRAIEAIGQACPASPTRPVVHFSPSGRRIDQALVQQLAQGPGAILICGRYEGVDQRFIDRHVSLELSLGDFVLSGGEIPALALLDAVARLGQGVIDPASHQDDSFSHGLLEGPVYTRPEVLACGGVAAAVPPEALSGHHAQIQQWRRQQSLERTARLRPDLIAEARLAGRFDARDEAFLASLRLE
jgi:tRNA (guanine37-N1)-methyltransferase